MITSRIGSQNALIAINTDTWRRNADRRRKKTNDNALNVIKKGI